MHFFQMLFYFYIFTIITIIYINLYPYVFYTGIYIMPVAFELWGEFGSRTNLPVGNSFY